MNRIFLFLVLTSLVTGATWSPSPSHNHRVVIEFAEESDGHTKVLVSQPEDIGFGGFSTTPKELFGKCRDKVTSAVGMTKNMVCEKTEEFSNKFRNFEEKTKEVVDDVAGKISDPKEFSEKVMKNMVSDKTNEGSSKFHSLEEKAKDVVNDAVGKVVGDPKVKFTEKITETVKTVGEKAKDIAGSALGMVSVGGSTVGTLKDSVVKVEQWDLVDSPKRIGEDIERNASRKVEEGIEEVKETVEIVKETSLHDLLTTSTKKVTVLVDTIQSVISWCHLFGFSIAYGMGVWVTFLSSSVLGKCVPKRQYRMIVDKLYMVYFRAMAYCVGAAYIGYLVSRGRRVFYLCNKMELFQGFNLLSALLMSLTNTMLLEPRAAKLIAERKKVKEESGTKSEAGQKLKKLNAYTSTLNVSTMVVLTWHLAYIGQLLQARHP